MLVAVVGALVAFASQADAAGSAPAPQAEKPKMVEVCTRVPDPGGRVPKRVCKKVPQKQDAAAGKPANQSEPPAQDAK